MRRVLVDAARARRAVQARRQGVEAVVARRAWTSRRRNPCVDILALEDALTALAAIDPRPSQVVELRFFGGFTVEETAEALGVSVRTVINDWNTARAWLSPRAHRSGARHEHRPLAAVVRMAQCLARCRHGLNAIDCGVNSPRIIRTSSCAGRRAWRPASAGLPGLSRNAPRSRSPPAISPRTTRCSTPGCWSDRIGLSGCWRAVAWAMSTAPRTSACVGTWRSSFWPTPAPTTRQRIERFLQEARITAALDHANIVKVFDVGVLDGRPYLVAELLDGETLRARLGRGPLAAAEARRIAGEVACRSCRRACGRPGSPRFETGQCFSDAIRA